MDFDVRGQQGMDFFTGGSVIKIIMMDLFITNMQIETCSVDNLWTIVIGCLDSHSDGTHSLQRIHWWANNVKYNSPNLF